VLLYGIYVSECVHCFYKTFVCEPCRWNAIPSGGYRYVIYVIYITIIIIPIVHLYIYVDHILLYLYWYGCVYPHTSAHSSLSPTTVCACCVRMWWYEMGHFMRSVESIVKYNRYNNNNNNNNHIKSAQATQRPVAVVVAIRFAKREPPQQRYNKIKKNFNIEINVSTNPLRPYIFNNIPYKYLHAIRTSRLR
jgi:hypothetical protein